MESQVKGIEEWADNIEALAERGIDQGLLLKLENMGPQGAAYVEAFTKMSDEELKKASDLFQKSLDIPSETKDRLVKAYEDAGRQTGDAYKAGIEESTPVTEAAAREQGEKLIKAAQEALGSNKNDSEFKKAGEKIPQQISDGINAGEPELEATIEETGEKTVAAVEDNLEPSRFEDSGAGIIKGISDGVLGSVGTLQGSIDKALGSIVVNTNNIKIDTSGLNANIRSSIASATADAAAQASTQQVNVDTNVYLEGDAKGVFNMVRQETQQYVKSTGYNPLTGE